MASKAVVDGSGTMGGAASWPPLKKPAALGFVFDSVESAEAEFRADVAKSSDSVSNDRVPAPPAASVLPPAPAFALPATVAA